MVTEIELTPTQQRIMNLLSDGLSHTRNEIHMCLSDNLSARSALKFHITAIRKYLEPRGETVLCVVSNGPIAYRYVRIIK